MSNFSAVDRHTEKRGCGQTFGHSSVSAAVSFPPPAMWQKWTHFIALSLWQNCCSTLRTWTGMDIFCILAIRVLTGVHLDLTCAPFLQKWHSDRSSSYNKLQYLILCPAAKLFFLLSLITSCSSLSNIPSLLPIVAWHSDMFKNFCNPPLFPICIKTLCLIFKWLMLHCYLLRKGRKEKAEKLCFKASSFTEGCN